MIPESYHGSHGLHDRNCDSPAMSIGMWWEWSGSICILKEVTADVSVCYSPLLVLTSE